MGDNEEGTGRIGVHEDDEDQVFGFCDFVELLDNSCFSQLAGREVRSLGQI